MDIDFNSLSFKIQKPTSFTQRDSPSSTYNQPVLPFKLTVKQMLSFEDTHPTITEEETINPFKRTSHLFKHIQASVYNNEDSSIRYSKLNRTSSNSNDLIFAPEKGSKVFSLENFDSFQNNETKFTTEKECLFQSKAKNEIRIETENFDELSLIMDNIDYESKECNFIEEKQVRRVKTEYTDMAESEEVKKKKDNDGIFCLTAQALEESSESNVKEFYLDLREEQNRVECSTNKEVSVKKELKELIYNFIDDLEIMEENEIDPNSIQKISKCIQTVFKPKTSPLAPKSNYSNKENIDQVPQKWMKMSHSQTEKKLFDKSLVVPYSEKKELKCSKWVKNKENSFCKNKVGIHKNAVYQINSNNTSLSYRDMNNCTSESKSRKWVL